MTNFGTSLRDPASGDYLANIFFDGWLYFDYVKKVNDTSRVQGIFSPFHSPSVIGLFDQLNGASMDRLIEVWFKPYAITGLDNSNLSYYLDKQYFCRYDRKEHLNDGRPRDTFIGRSVEHLLKRVRVLPPQDPLVAPYLPVAPWAVPPHHYVSETTPLPIPTGAGAWPLPSSEGYTGAVPAPPAALVGTSTAHRMCQLVQYCKDYINLNALQDVTIEPPTGSGGLVDHPIDIRYNNLLTTLQEMSAASWHAWYYGELPLGQLPVDFTLDPDPAAPNKWIFRTRIGGAGVDRSIDGVLGGGDEPVVLSVGNDNIIQPVSTRDWIDHITRVFVGGKNSGVDRDVIAVVNLDRAQLSPWNLNDHFIHSSKQAEFDFTGTPTDGIFDAIERGTSRLQEDGPREELSVLVRLNRNLGKGRNFEIGDIVTTSIFGETQNVQIREIRHLVTKSGGVNIGVELGALDGSRFKGGNVMQKIAELIRANAEDAENIGESQ